MKWLVLSTLIVAVVWSGLALVETQQQRRELFAEKESLRVQLDELQITWGKLQLELATFAGYVRIEELAREKLSMHMPSIEQIQVLEP
ncbi:cell division protein FtsL [Solemya velum gill symbiont]|uniref:Cell division protein FtsL n=1 Tax=Solemya velum gill symbiont TaxID=2340 RepID=A0A0B0HEB4_SOVGS|nr:cell division protein FtsL [Solemya velum gill symbiont]KHF26264.1 cell division protein FtsL [Solemya velum gill symbiont]OOY35972.1 cell division protein FtsL [Solemya velum gill symbiont]OOY38812.1 cell division protein FtsL [Solemya velum gill symbiont]OOY40741.1 cell division protein FtsL [Solemya velum gill symbiont]OOY43062.1 cell division protein FtsL [Solemya velum gill symbiont]